MQIPFHNNEHKLLVDIAMFGWPLGYVFIRVLLSSSRSTADSLRAATLMVSVLGIFDLFLLSSIDADSFRGVAKDAPLLAICAVLAIALLCLTLFLQWRANSLDNQDALGGVMEQPAVARGNTGRSIAKYLGISAAALTGVFIVGLFVLAH